MVNVCLFVVGRFIARPRCAKALANLRRLCYNFLVDVMRQGKRYGLFPNIHRN